MFEREILAGMPCRALPVREAAWLSGSHLEGRHWSRNRKAWLLTASSDSRVEKKRVLIEPKEFPGKAWGF